MIPSYLFSQVAQRYLKFRVRMNLHERYYEWMNWFSENSDDILDTMEFIRKMVACLQINRLITSDPSS